MYKDLQRTCTVIVLLIKHQTSNYIRPTLNLLTDGVLFAYAAVVCLSSLLVFQNDEKAVK